MYYDLESIPEKDRIPWSNIGAVFPGRQALGEQGVNEGIPTAMLEGGPKNGVLTAIEDFMQSGKYELLNFPGNGGFGVMKHLNRGRDIADGFGNLWDHLELSLNFLFPVLQAVEDSRNLQACAAMGWIKTARKMAEAVWREEQDGKKGKV